jgi:predicted Fe-Mo cluster-binding NifX family protein
MRIAISAEGDRGLDSIVSPHFGRCPSYVLVDVEDGQAQELRVVDNPYHAQHVPGQVPAFIRSQGVDVMLTGGMGWRAIALFEEYGIEAVSGAQGTVRRALGSYLGGELRGVQPCEAGHDRPPADLEYEQDEVGRMQEELAMLRQQMAQTLDRLDKLGGNQQTNERRDG